MNNYSMDELLDMVREEASRTASDTVTSAEDVFKILAEYSTKDQEHILLITLDGASKVIRKEVIHIGTVNQSMVHPRDVFRPAIVDNAVGIIIAHNHPSGTLEASIADIKITQRLKEGSKILGIELLDHVIIAKGGYYSMSDDGVL